MTQPARVWCRVCGKETGSRVRGEDGSIWAGTIQPNPHLLKGDLCPGASVPAAEDPSELPRSIGKG